MLRLDRSNEGCSIDESRESVRLGLKSSDPRRLGDGNKDGEIWSSDISRPCQGNSLRLGNQESGNSGQTSLSRGMDQEYRAG